MGKLTAIALGIPLLAFERAVPAAGSDGQRGARWMRQVVRIELVAPPAP